MTGYFEGRYTGPLFALSIIIDKANENENSELLAAATIWRVYIFSYLTDLWGDIPYSEALQGLLGEEGTITPVYDTQQDVYIALIAELEAANSLLTNSSLNFGSGDLLFGGDPMAWKKFGNSLKLRILNRAAGTPWSFTYDMVGIGAFTVNAGSAAMGNADAYTELAPLYVMCLDEVEFIQAEYYMRKGDDGKAKSHYEAGIVASMNRWGCADGGTVSASNKGGVLPFSYDVDHDVYLAQPLVAWGGTTGEKFQKIIEQKWAGMYGQGVQAWNEVRRTGFPARIFEYELEDDYTPNMGMPIRIHYSYNEETYNKTNLEDAKARQNVEDLNDGMYSTSGTSSQMWWHTRKNPIPTEIDPPAEDEQ